MLVHGILLLFAFSHLEEVLLLLLGLKIKIVYIHIRLVLLDALDDKNFGRRRGAEVAR